MTELQEGLVQPTAAGSATSPGRPERGGKGHSSVAASRARSVLKHVLMIAVSFVMIYPLLWLLVSSFRPTDVIFRTPGLWLNDLVIENYTEGWFALGQPFGHYIINSAIVVVGAVVGNVFACSLAAYAFARLRFRLKTLWFSIMLVTVMLPIHVVLVPQYILFNKLGWVNTFVPLILPKFLAVDAFFIFLMVQFIRGIPRELDEAARIDGCGHWRIFSRVLMPLMGPAVATCAIFTIAASGSAISDGERLKNTAHLLGLTSPLNIGISSLRVTAGTAVSRSSWINRRTPRRSL